MQKPKKPGAGKTTTEKAADYSEEIKKMDEQARKRSVHQHPPFPGPMHVGIPVMPPAHAHEGGSKGPTPFPGHAAPKPHSGGSLDTEIVKETVGTIAKLAGEIATSGLNLINTALGGLASPGPGPVTAPPYPDPVYGYHGYEGYYPWYGPCCGDPALFMHYGYHGYYYGHPLNDYRYCSPGVYSC
ncbi:MAG: hypothetical protein JW768_00195 [Chitinispirillaceae bacterium]|nr:hypothetical protein [Chitinispirillaceae bacterium]